MRLQDFLNEEEDQTKDEKEKAEKAEKVRLKSRKALKSGLRKLEDHMDDFIDDIENEIEKIGDNPTFKYKIGLMLSNLSKEQGEYTIALRQIVQTIGKRSGLIPQVRGHAKGMMPDPFNDDEEDAKMTDTGKEEEQR
jgi:hypothetical protein